MGAHVLVIDAAVVPAVEDRRMRELHYWFIPFERQVRTFFQTRNSALAQAKLQ